ncbi:NAD(P)-dependent dehydrogenase (short-subunit alcohol dehydrogenase family) [Pseudomonas protegens]|uniref:SDR family NAD(P)-dependent oxidoreductase n=1 Tax=Pseudomonas TaxID=286 RepID=UPI000CD29447|nr:MULTISPECIES: SDR family NAD(P)-dependent oxidoreductase [Pseudomonas]MBF0643387.1 SDR family NAD(P)-dependent oxidoreductase [Pseudomonas protegens]MCS4259933.1 NAD(P)-dependent dehydrogenase (short-subunit alcohol dehydrogenase family) [Pseudomonas sp. BIGb0176]POA85437.1 short-chain dehydrogenase [Pseudomonas protegens]QYN03888.1 SDR family NAD(P)-dependent oxidoreductase [Pseudomonas protegens]ROQ62495.1 NAD(P)-dependent dehydrogenase (short-subunit alcohol dehydrogenase family) [Pseudo
MDFSGRTAIVTGAGRGLGLSYARALARRGAQVVISDCGSDGSGSGADDSVAHDAVQALRASGARALADTADLGTEAGCQGLVQRTLEAFGSLDILIHNAGWVGYQALEQTDAGFLERMLGINLYAPIWLARHAWPHLRQSAAPRLLLTTSDRALYPEYAQPGLLAYCAGKMAQVGIMNALGQEGAEHGIRVNAVSPVAKTRMWGVSEEPPELKPDWVTPGVLFLVSEQCQDSGYILRASNGQFSAWRPQEAPGVDYPRDLKRIAAATPEQFARRWGQIKQPFIGA